VVLASDAEGWTYENGPEIVSIFREQGGVGALQLSFARRRPPEAPTPEAVTTIAKSYATQRGWRLRDEAIRLRTIDNSPCAEFDYVQSNGENSYWQVWHVLDAARLAFATYLCEPADAKIEQSERETIVTSLKWL